MHVETLNWSGMTLTHYAAAAKLSRSSLRRWRDLIDGGEVEIDWRAQLRRAAEDFAQCMREISDVYFPKAEKIRVVMDNLSTHSPSALYQTFPAPEARRVLRRLEFHYTPRHASWLNMVEIEIGVLRSQCLDRRIDSRDRLVSEIAAWERQRNSSRARIKWMFTAEKARAKMARAYPTPINES
jgi:hypothetical protein